MIEVALAVSGFLAASAQANPLGANVVNGSASISQSSDILTITNTPNISKASRLLLCAMTSNGRVFLINPTGILVVQGARINVAELVISSLTGA